MGRQLRSSLFEPPRGIYSKRLLPEAQALDYKAECLLSVSRTEQVSSWGRGTWVGLLTEQSWAWGLRAKDLLLEHWGRISSSLDPPTSSREHLSFPNSVMGAGISEQGNGGHKWLMELLLGSGGSGWQGNFTKQFELHTPYDLMR